MIVTDISYDRNIPLLSVSPSTWTATPYARWFDNYNIISSIDNPLARELHVIDIRKYAGNTAEPLTTVKNIFSSQALAKLESAENLQGHFYIMNRAGSDKLGVRRKKLTNDISVVSKFENKAWFRRKFQDVLRFAPNRFIGFDELEKHSYETLSDMLGGDLVLQHPGLAGSRGTYIVRSEDEYQYAVANLLQTDQTSGEPVVVSRYLDKAIERTVQGCVTSTDVLVGPPQAQLVRQPELVSSRPGDIQFCGGRIAPGLVSEAQKLEMERAMKIVGTALQDAGYRGVFGMDFLIYSTEVYILEANPRMTGLSPLLADLQNTHPFLLLHVLELAHQEYDVKSAVQFDDTAEGSFIQIYAQTDCQVNATTGVYDAELNKVGSGFENSKLLPKNDNHFFVGLRVDPHASIETGKSIAFVYSRKQLFDDEGALTPEALRFTKSFRSKFISK